MEEREISRSNKREIVSMLQNQKGIGLVEIIIAILIFAVGISIALRVLPISNTATSRARNLTVATNLAQEKIEELMSSPFNSADLSAGDHADTQNPLQRHFTRSWSVTDDVPMSDMKRVAITVSFSSGSNDSTVTLTTYITSRR